MFTWRQSTLLLLRNMVFSPSASGRVKPLVQKHWDKVQYDWLTPFFLPLFVAMGDAFLLLMQYQHCRNCHCLPLQHPPTPIQLQYNLISIPFLCFNSPSLIPLRFFVFAPLALTSVYICTMLSFSMHPSFLSSLLFFFSFFVFLFCQPLPCLFTSPLLGWPIFQQAVQLEAAKTCVYRVRSVPSLWVSGTGWETVSTLILALPCPAATCRRLTRTPLNHSAETFKYGVTLM